MPIDNIFQLRDWKPPYRPDAIIEDGLLLPGTAMMTFGAAGTWKTINSTHLAFCIATGTAWFGYKTTPANIFIHQVELPKVIARDRVIQYADGIGWLPKNIFFETPEDQILLDTTYGISAFAKSIEEVKSRVPDTKLPLVVILDPLYLHMSGSVSDSEDTKKFLLNVNLIKKKYDVTFIVVHHARLTRVDNAGQVVDLGAEEIMGSSYWNNWLDTIVRIKLVNPFTGSDTIKLSWDKHRNAHQYHYGFTVKWDRANLVPSVTDRDIPAFAEPSVRGLLEEKNEKPKV